MKEHPFNHFRELYSNNDETDPEAQANLFSGIPSLINDIENRELEKPTTEYEIRNTFWSLHVDKAPRPDGFTINFYRAAWDIIK